MNGLRLALCLLTAGCTIGPTVPKGQVTVQGRGSEALTNQGDPLITVPKYNLFERETLTV